MRKLSWMLLASLVHAEDETLLVIGNAKELKGVTAKKIVWEKDGAKMVLIPANPSITESKSNAFFMDAHEVAVGQFKKFLQSSGYKPHTSIDWKKMYMFSSSDNHPMIYVTWHDAAAYTKWTGKRLPSEKEWEFAARGRLNAKLYPWRNSENLASDYANYRGTCGKTNRINKPHQ